jgi:hypothetical protein
MPLHELQVAETEGNEFLTVCLLGGGRTSCQPNLLCRRGSRFRVVPINPDEEDSSYEIHIAGNVVQRKIPVHIYRTFNYSTCRRRHVIKDQLDEASLALIQILF